MKPAEWSIGLGRDFPAFFEMPSEPLDFVSNFTGHARGRPLRRDPGARDNSGDTRSPGLLRSIAGSVRWGSAGESVAADDLCVPDVSSDRIATTAFPDLAAMTDDSPS